MLRQILSNVISMLVATISLFLSWYWYTEKQEIEPIIGMVASSGVLLTGLVFRIFPEQKEEPTQASVEVNDSKNVVVNSVIKTDGDVQIGDNPTVNNEGANIGTQFNGGTFHNPNFH